MCYQEVNNVSRWCARSPAGLKLPTPKMAAGARLQHGARRNINSWPTFPLSVASTPTVGSESTGPVSWLIQISQSIIKISNGDQNSVKDPTQFEI